jgi:hypothetical protein
MKIVLILLAILYVTSASATDLFLDFETECSSTGKSLKFVCEKSKKERVLIFNENSEWYGRNPQSGDVWELGIVKADDYIVVLNNPVFFSGTSVIHLMRATDKFYWSEVAYSDILEQMEVTIRIGTISVVRK